MHVAITGAAGFLGNRLARELLLRSSFPLPDGGNAEIGRLTLIDRVRPPDDVTADARSEIVLSDLYEDLVRAPRPDRVLPGQPDFVFHLAAAVSGECEADFDLGWHANVDVTRALLEICRQLETRPRFIFASSVAVFGSSPTKKKLVKVADDTLPAPQSSYGFQKYVCEQLVADYTRKGFVDGRSVRLMTVCVRPGLPNAAASQFLSAIIREPLAGRPAICPVAPETEVALASPRKTLEGLVCAATASNKTWGGSLALNLPALRVSVSDMVKTLGSKAGREIAARIEWKPDHGVAAIVTSWPATFVTDRASALGLSANASFDEILDEYLNELVQQGHNTLPLDRHA